MSDIQNTPTEIPVEASQTPTEVTSEKSSPRGSDRRSDRPYQKNNNRSRSRRPQEEEKEFREEMLEIARVTRVTAGGRQIRFRATVVIGDGKGRVGLGIGKSGEVQGAIEKAIRDAKKNLIQFDIVQGTIAHDVNVNFKSSSLYLHPAHPGTGIIAGGAVRKICAVAGIQDIIAKQHGAPNKITNARVALKAFSALKPTSMVVRFESKTK